MWRETRFFSCILSGERYTEGLRFFSEIAQKPPALQRLGLFSFPLSLPVLRVVIDGRTLTRFGMGKRILCSLCESFPHVVPSVRFQQVKSA
jgi:hypothetical protein